ncbi:hypothetical protein C2E23DRAFT_733876 [Lenzites betulinus]|nr:hypothetical protein C2E23DRAFT_733876 [Lenzites betulinus]
MNDPNAIFQNCFYVGNTFNAILFGIELMLYVASTTIILRNEDPRNARSFRLFLYLSTGLLLMITIYVAVQAVFGQEMWVVHADYPGGSAAYLADNAAVWYQTLGSAASIVLNLMSDGLLLYRSYVVWEDWRPIVLPCILYFATAALGIMTCVFTGLPNSNFFVGRAAEVALAYSSVVIGLNVTLSLLICGRLLWHARAIERTLGRRVAHKYTGAVALIVEAALPYTLFGIAYVVTLGLDSPVSILFLSIYVMFTCVSPQMLILRIVMGRGFTQSTATQTMPTIHIATSQTDKHLDRQLSLDQSDSELSPSEDLPMGLV